MNTDDGVFIRSLSEDIDIYTYDAVFDRRRQYVNNLFIAHVPTVP